LDGLRRILRQKVGDALVADAVWKALAVALDELDTLIDPARQIFADIKEHSQLGVPAVEQRPIQVVVARLARRQEPLQLQTGARTFD
jgi:hypothetical protein